MAKKQVSYGDYEVIVEDGGKIVVMQSGQVLPNAKAGLRAIAEAAGFDFDPNWTTQQGGSKLVKFLASAPAAAAPAQAKAVQSQPAPVAKNNNKPKDEELTPEEMKQLDEILKRLEALEARLAKLEKAPSASTAAATGKREVITDKKQTSDYIYFKTSEGRVLDGGYYFYHRTVGMGGYLMEIKKILIEIGEEDAIDLSSFDDSSLNDAKEKRTEAYEKFIMQVARLATKYGSKGTLPALLPNDVLLYSDGEYRKTTVSKKSIKF